MSQKNTDIYNKIQKLKDEYDYEYQRLLGLSEYAKQNNMDLTRLLTKRVVWLKVIVDLEKILNDT